MLCGCKSRSCGPNKRLLKWPLVSPGGSEPVIGPQEICGRIAFGTRSMAVESGVVYPLFEQFQKYGPGNN
jgi:hypothetical protein